jgi:hypothetical protein
MLLGTFYGSRFQMVVNLDEVLNKAIRAIDGNEDGGYDGNYDQSDAEN